MARELDVLTATRPAAGRSRIPTAALLVTALVLTGLSMRTAVTSVGAELDDLKTSLHTGNVIAGLLTTLPVLCFAGIGALAPALSHRFGAHRLLVSALALMTAGLLGRALVGSIWAFLALSVLALTGGAISNVLMPSLVKRHFPDQLGRMTAVYTTALAIGLTAAAGLTVPIGSLASSSDGWRLGLGSWAVLSGLAVLPWLPTLRGDRADSEAPRHLSANVMVRSRTAWLLMVFFAFQSFQAYIAFGWFATLLHADGVSTDTAGWMVALLAAMSIPISMVVPMVSQSHHRALLAGLTACYVFSYAGLAVAPAGGAWLWMVLTGIGAGTFPLALTMIGLHAHTAEATAALSAFAQSIGYVLAGTGPLLFGVLHGVTGGWGVPIALLFVATTLTFVSGWVVAAPTYVEDELAASAA